MGQWYLCVVGTAIFLLLLEARFSFGSRIIRIERDMAWLIAGLKKWGLAAPGYEEPPRVVIEPDQSQRPIPPPARK
jgi:hypothetical protein